MDDEDTEPHRHLGMFRGVVVSNADPLGLGRVRVRIPGLIDESGWAPPIGGPGSGKKRRGFFFAPEDGADVVVFFDRGDVDAPYYMGGHWGIGETPTAVNEVPFEDRPKVGAIETARFIVVFDDRKDHEKLYLKDKQTGTQIQLDGAGAHVTTPGTFDVTAVGIVNVTGAHVNLQGGGAGIARVGDAVSGQINPGLVMVPDPVTGSPIPNIFPVPVDGAIAVGSTKASSG